MTVEARELYLFATNEYSLYESIKGIEAGLRRKLGAGTFNRELAPKAYKTIVDTAAKIYCKRFGGVYHQIFTVATRTEVCEEFVKNFLDDYE